jgi:hypothetical protein
MAYKDAAPEEYPVDEPGEFVQIYRKIPVARVDIGEDGSVPLEAAVLMELGQRLSSPDESVTNVQNGSMHDRYEASWKGHSVVVKLGDYATEDEL